MKNKHEDNSWGFIIIALVIISFYVMNDSNNERRHQEEMHVQDSVNARLQYVIDFHFVDCDFTPNKNQVPFHPDNESK